MNRSTQEIEMPNQYMIVRFTDGRRVEFIAKNISRGLEWADTIGTVESWTNQVTMQPISEPVWTVR